MTTDPLTAQLQNDFFATPQIKHTLRLVPQSQRDLFTSELSCHLDTLIKQTAKEVYEDMLENGLPEEAKPNGVLMVDGVKVTMKLHSDMQVGHNTARNHTKKYIEKQISNLSE